MKQKIQRWQKGFLKKVPNLWEYWRYQGLQFEDEK
jgi:hypothetical protein